jgi:hypothetical protein
MLLSENLQPHPLSPPAPPWRALRPTEEEKGVLSVYYSEDQAAVPVRAIMLPNNNKSDPNIETATYGLFSTCSQGTRAGIVKRGTRYMFFVTRRGKGRMLTGYYRLKWYTPGNLAGSDFAVAADHVHFIDPGLPLRDLPEEVRSHCMRRFRLALGLDASATRVLLDALHSRPNALERYLAEVDRIECRNMHLTGFRYVAWQRKEPFTWDEARLYLPGMKQLPPPLSGAARRITQSRSGKWRCTQCDKITSSAALLRLCPSCKHAGTLIEFIESTPSELMRLALPNTSSAATTR